MSDGRNPTSDEDYIAHILLRQVWKEDRIRPAKVYEDAFVGCEDLELAFHGQHIQPCVEIEDHIAAEIALEDKNIAAAAPSQIIVATAGDKPVRAPAAAQASLNSDE